ncbi:MAG TPA: hypothetical protein VGF01_09775 [Terracidiphilus sp.]
MRLGCEDILNLEVPLKERSFQGAKVFKSDVAKDKGARRLRRHENSLREAADPFHTDSIAQARAVWRNES